MVLTKEQIKAFEKASRPLIKFINDFHPHTEVIVKMDGAEFLETICGVKIEDYIKD